MSAPSASIGWPAARTRAGDGRPESLILVKPSFCSAPSGQSSPAHWQTKYIWGVVVASFNQMNRLNLALEIFVNGIVNAVDVGIVGSQTSLEDFIDGKGRPRPVYVQEYLDALSERRPGDGGLLALTMGGPPDAVGNDLAWWDGYLLHGLRFAEGEIALWARLATLADLATATRMLLHCGSQTLRTLDFPAELGRQGA
jgi:hypothetical protein